MDRNFKLPDVDPRVFFRLAIIDVKKSLPKTCTFLAPYKTRKGEYYVKAIVKRKGKDVVEKFYSVPPNFVYTTADKERLKEQVLLHC
jgi:hypothetical protein